MDIIRLQIEFHDRSTITTFISSDEDVNASVIAWLYGTPGAISVSQRIQTRDATCEQLHKIDRLKEFQIWLGNFRPTVIPRISLLQHQAD